MKRGENRPNTRLSPFWAIGLFSILTTVRISSSLVITRGTIQGFAESLRKEPQGINIRPVEPGTMSSDMRKTTREAEREQQQKDNMLQTEDMLFACSTCSPN